jgi:predicted outer membrane protein
VAPPSAPAPPPEDPTHFSSERFRANVATLVKLGARAPSGEGAARARAWLRANAPGARGPIALVAPLAARGDTPAALAEASSGAALVAEAARALGAQGRAAQVLLFDESVAAPDELAGAGLAIYVSRACALPQRRDLLSHRVLRERFFDLAGGGGAGFEQSRAPHAALQAAGARRVVALDAPPAPGAECDPAAFGDALVRFVSDASELLARGRVNTLPAPSSEATDGVRSPQENS